MLLLISVAVVVPKNFKLHRRYFPATGSFYVLPVIFPDGVIAATWYPCITGPGVLPPEEI